MALEDTMERLIVALKENTEAHGGKPSGAGKPGVGKPATAAAAASDKITLNMVKAAIIKVRDQISRPKAMKILADVGKATELNGIKPARFSSVMAACEAALEETTDSDEDTAPDDDEL